MLHDRRTFLKQSGRVIAGTALATLPIELTAGLARKIVPSDNLNVGLIGCKGMGWNNLKSFLKIDGVAVKAICDIDENILNQRKAELEPLGIRPSVYKDYRKLLDDTDVDVVIIGTPDHWHCLQLVDACAAGKDVFVEKPLANSIEESRLMVAAVKKYSRIVQVNQWQRSQAHFQDAIQYIHGGALGKIVMVKTWMHRAGTLPLPPLQDESVPDGVDYDAWLGPALKRPFNKNRFHYEFRWFWDYAGGLMTDWGVHLLDIALWGMKCDYPNTIVSTGGKYVFPEDARETPDTQNVLYNYGNFDITWEHTMAGGRGYYNQNHGIAFTGEKGTLIVSRRGWEVLPEKELIAPVAWTPSSDNGLDMHTANFVDAVRRKDPTKLNCPIPIGALCAEVSHLGNIAVRSNQQLHWNKERGNFKNRRANKFLGKEYHNGWKLPKL